MMRDILIGAAGAIVASLIAAAVEGIFGVLSDLLGPPVPRGAVVAFDGDCPNGWEPYQLGAGRFLLGANKNRELHDEGGSETHKLTVAEMPRHNHDEGRWLLVGRTGDNTVHAKTDNTGAKEINIRHGFSMVPMGEGKSHNNMPPFLVVNFCEKR